jgi:hypothetical protein
VTLLLLPIIIAQDSLRSVLYAAILWQVTLPSMHLVVARSLTEIGLTCLWPSSALLFSTLDSV